MLEVTVTDSLDYLRMLSAASSFDTFGFWSLADRFDAEVR